MYPQPRASRTIYTRFRPSAWEDLNSWPFTYLAIASTDFLLSKNTPAIFANSCSSTVGGGTFVTVREASACSEPFTALIWMWFFSDVEVKWSTKGAVVGGGNPLSVHCDFRGRWRNLAFHLNRVLGYRGEPEGELTTSSGLGEVSFPPPLFLFFCASFPPPFPANADRQAPTTKTTKNAPKHPRTSRPVVLGPRGCASACSRGCVPVSCCGGGGTGTSA